MDNSVHGHSSLHKGNVKWSLAASLRLRAESDARLTSFRYQVYPGAETNKHHQGISKRPVDEDATPLGNRTKLNATIISNYAHMHHDQPRRRQGQEHDSLITPCS